MKSKEELQKEWDTLLIQAWYCRDDHYVNYIAMQFRNIYGDWPYNLGLERVGPAYHGARKKLTVRRYICAYMPKFANWLFNVTDREKALEVFGTRKPRKRPFDEKVRKGQTKELEATRKMYMVAKEAKHANHEEWESYNASNQWNKCK